MIINLLVVLLGIDWASGYAIASYVMNHGVSPIAYAFWQAVGPAIVLLIIQGSRLQLTKALFIQRHNFLYALGCSLFGITIPNILMYFLAQHVYSEILTIIANITPLIIYPLALIKQQESFNIKKLILLFIGVTGVLILITPFNFLTSLLQTNYLSNNFIYWSLLIPFCYAYAAIFIAKPNYNKLSIKTSRITNINLQINYALYMLILASIIIIPIGYLTNQIYILKFNDINSLLMVLEILLSSIGYVLLFIIINKVGPVAYSVVSIITASTGIFYGYFIFNHVVSLVNCSALILIIIAIIGLSMKITTKPCARSFNIQKN